MNKYICIGRLGQDPDIKSVKNGEITIATFSIAVERKYKRDGEPTADFFDCTAFGKIAEFCENYLRKGMKIAVEGHLQKDTVEKDGKKTSYVKIIVESIEFAENKNSGSGDSESRKESKPKAKATYIEDDDIPFK